MNAQQWNERYPVGTMVRYWPVQGRPLSSTTDAPTRSEAWDLPSGHSVVLIEGKAGGVYLDNIEPLRRPDGELWVVQPQTPTLSEKEPPPRRNDGPAIWSLVIQDMQERDVEGERRYGTRLQPFNGRDSLVDLYQELLDAVVYIRQTICERDAEKDPFRSDISNELLESIAQHAEAASLDPARPGCWKATIAPDNLHKLALELLQRRRALRPPSNWNDAKRLSRNAWHDRLRRRGIDVSVSDAYTDGFHDGAVWRQQVEQNEDSSTLDRVQETAERIIRELTDDEDRFLAAMADLSKAEQGDDPPRPWEEVRRELDLDGLTGKGAEARLAKIAAIIEAVDNRCAAADGPVTPTLREMRQDELSEIYQLASGMDPEKS